MQLYYTTNSPYARLARIAVIEKGLSNRVQLIPAMTRTQDSPYYRINPSGRVPFLICDDSRTMEDSQLICNYLDLMDGNPRLHLPFAHENWAYGRLETYARSLTDGVSVFIREMRRPENERSPGILKHELDRSLRLADQWEREIEHPLMQGPLNMAQLLLIVGLDFAAFAKMATLDAGRPRLTAWASRLRETPSVQATAPRPG